MQTPASGTRRTRERLRTLAQYIQRLSAKNDSISAYGPTSWGTVDEQRRGLSIAPVPGIARRTVYFERWVIDALVTVMNRDADAVATSPRTIEAPALDPHGFDALLEDVRGWRAGAAKDRWSTVLGALADAKRRFAQGTEDRLAIVERTLELLRSTGIPSPRATRALYAATNLFGESCARDTGAVLGGDLHQLIATDAAPWYDLWQDVHAHVSSEVARQLCEVVDLARPMPLPEYLERCRAAGFDLLTDALPRIAAEAFSRVQAAWTGWLAGSAPDAPRRTLTAEDLAFVRRTFPATRVRDFSFPSVDVQLVAPTLEHTQRGELEVVIAELHGGVALLSHAISWACPAPAQLATILAGATGGVPLAYLGQAGTFLSCHTALQFARFRTISSCGEIAGRRGWRTVRLRGEVTSVTAPIFASARAMVTTSARSRERGPRRWGPIRSPLRGGRTRRDSTSAASSSSARPGRSPRPRCPPWPRPWPRSTRCAPRTAGPASCSCVPRRGRCVARATRDETRM